MTTSSAVEQEPRLDYVTCASGAGVHRMAYWEWGDPTNPKVLLCVHGLTRSGRDFDPVARAFAQDYRVVCPDVVGRGHSDWLTNPQYYVVAQYVADMLVLIARLRPERLDWVGTSMGGLIALALSGVMNASMAARSTHPQPLEPLLGVPLGRIVLNDIGPALDMDGLTRIGRYLDQPMRFSRLQDAEAYVRETCADFGPQTDEDWNELTKNVFVCHENGNWVKHYDLRIATPFKSLSAQAMKQAELLLWQSYQAIRSPVLILRGERSDLLSNQSTQEMLQRNRQAQCYQIAGVGHAPTLRNQEQIQVLRDFLR